MIDVGLRVSCRSTEAPDIQGTRSSSEVPGRFALCEARIGGVSWHRCTGEEGPVIVERE
jgi:hypothetical protein